MAVPPPESIRGIERPGTFVLGVTAKMIGTYPRLQRLWPLPHRNLVSDARNHRELEHRFVLPRFHNFSLSIFHHVPLIQYELLVRLVVAFQLPGQNRNDQ